MSGDRSDIFPNRVSNLVALKASGSEVTCQTSFAVIKVDFRHQRVPYDAFVFTCTFRGEVDGVPYEFRKCYARGCVHNLCPHVSHAVMIANRYLQRDHRKLADGGIQIEERLFTLEDMVLKGQDHLDQAEAPLTVDDCIAQAAGGEPVAIVIEPEFVEVVEHFGGEERPQVFLTATFRATIRGVTHIIERCLCCYDPDTDLGHRARRVMVANARLQTLYRLFDEAGITYHRALFGS